MTSRAIRLIVRTIAIGIAIVAMVDPAFSISRPQRPKIVTVNLTSRGDAGERNQSSLLPCAADERCVVIADGTVDADLPADLKHPITLVVEKPASGPNIEVRLVIASASHAAAAGSVRVDLIRTGSIAKTDIRVTDGGALVGSATHEWQKETNTTIDVAWWPLAIGARTLHVQAVPVEGESTAIDNQIDVAVDVATRRGSILIFDARPSWSSTFVRRALEDDPRFIVGHRARVAPALTVGTASARLDEQVLDATDVAVIGGPDALTAADVS